MIDSGFITINDIKLEKFDNEIRYKLDISIGDNIGGESMEFEYILDVEFRRFFSGDVCDYGIEVYHLDESIHIDKDDIIITRGR
jgi:hypothetical protein